MKDPDSGEAQKLNMDINPLNAKVSMTFWPSLYATPKAVLEKAAQATSKLA
jgi:hypothetical protein